MSTREREQLAHAVRLQAPGDQPPPVEGLRVLLGATRGRHRWRLYLLGTRACRRVAHGSAARGEAADGRSRRRPIARHEVPEALGAAGDARGEIRTRMASRPADFKSAAYAHSATRAYLGQSTPPSGEPMRTCPLLQERNG